MITEFNNKKSHLKSLRKTKMKKKNIKLLKHTRKFVQGIKREYNKPFKGSQKIEPDLIFKGEINPIKKD